MTWKWRALQSKNDNDSAYLRAKLFSDKAINENAARLPKAKLRLKINLDIESINLNIQ